MIAPILQLYPFFKGGLPLKSDDLNQLVKYLESEDRNTRTCLIGMGNMYGLRIVANFANDDKSKGITITEGAGLTSLGYLMCSEKQIFTQYLKTQVNDTDFQDGLVNVVLTERGKTNVPSADSKRIDVWELKTTFKNSETPLSFKDINRQDLNNKVVVLLYQILGEVSDGCNLCDRTVNTNAVVRVLLMNEKDYINIEKDCPKTDAVAQPTIAFLKLNRLGFDGTKIMWSGFTSAEKLHLGYQTACSQAVSGMVTILEKTFSDFSPFFKNTEGVVAPNWDFTFLKTLTSFNTVTHSDINLLFSQYVHDYLRQLIRAYDEFVSTPVAISVRGLTNKNCFPRHLALGKLTANMGIIETADVRTPLYRPRFDDLMDTDFQRSHFLFNRIGVLLANSDFSSLISTPNTEGRKRDIRITPSAARSAALGQQAIPYFLNSAVVKNTWQYNLTKTGRTVVIPTYDDDTNDSFFYQNIFDNADFYRIEGHIGKTLGTVWDDLTGDGKLSFGKRGNLNLPFSVEIIELTAATRPTFTTLLEFIKKNSGLEHQGGVPCGGTFVLVVERNRIIAQETFLMRDLTDDQVDALPFYTVVADFCLPYRMPEKPRLLPVAYFTIENADKIMAGQVVRFVNQSPKPQIFEWFIDQQPVPLSEVDNVFDLRHIFNFDDDVETERTFVVRLVAKSIEDSKLPPDVATQGISIKRIVEKVSNPTALFKETKRGDLQGTGIPVTFENASLHADIYEWFVDGVLVQTDTSKVPFNRTFNFDDDVETERTFVVTLVAKSNNPKATAATDTTSQGVVIKRTIVKLEKPVANFEIGIRQRIPQSDKALKKGENITLNNKSSASALSFRWFVDNNEVSKVRDLTAQPFVFKDDAITEQDFVVTLIAYNKANQTGDEDVEKLTVTIRRDIPKVITVDFNIQTPAGLQFDENKKAVTEVSANGLEVTFANLSKKANRYQWSLFLANTTLPIADSVKLSAVEDSYGFNFTVRDGQSTTYLIQLIGYDDNEQEVLPRIEKHLTVSLPKVITADFEFETPANIRFGDKNEVEADALQISAEFINLAENGTHYEWRVFNTTKVKTLVENSVKKTEQKLDLYKFKFSVGDDNMLSSQVFLIQMRVFDKAGNEVVKREKIFKLNTTALGILNTELLEENMTHTAVVESVDEPISRAIDIRTVDGLTASRNLEARRRDYHQKVMDEGTANAPLSKLASYRNVLTFMTDYDKAVEEFDLIGALEKTFDKLDAFDKAFKANALQLIQNIKKADNIPEDMYRNVLQNLLFFYCDKLIHLLPEALTPNTHKTVREVLTRIKTEQSFDNESLTDLRIAWNVDDITTVQNALVVEELNKLFES